MTDEKSSSQDFNNQIQSSDSTVLKSQPDVPHPKSKRKNPFLLKRQLEVETNDGNDGPDPKNKKTLLVILKDQLPLEVVENGDVNDNTPPNVYPGLILAVIHQAKKAEMTDHEIANALAMRYGTRFTSRMVERVVWWMCSDCVNHHMNSVREATLEYYLGTRRLSKLLTLLTENVLRLREEQRKGKEFANSKEGNHWKETDLKEREEQAEKEWNNRNLCRYEPVWAQKGH